MDFDIHQLDRVAPDSDGADSSFAAFQDALLERFAQSQEGQERLKVDPDMGHWAAHLMYYAFQYEGAALAEMTVADVRSVVTDLFPRKISLLSPEQANDIVPELMAFWSFLKREFQLPQCDDVLEFLQKLAPDFPDIMNDPANFGMAKSFFTMGRDAGFDMTTKEGTNAFMLAYNAQVAGRLPQSSLPVPPALGESRRLDPATRAAERKAERKRLKRAEQAKKRNRQQRR